MKRFQLGVMALSILAVAAGVGIAQRRELSNLDMANANAQAKIAPRQAGSCPAPVVASGDDGALSELTNLEKRVGAQSAELDQLRAEIAAAAPLPWPAGLPFSMLSTRIPKEAWAFAGYDTPEHTLESMLWAARDGNAQALRDSFTTNALEGAHWDQEADAALAEEGSQFLSNVTDLQILKYEVQDNSNRLHLTVYFDGLAQKDQPLWMDAQRVGDAWKFDSVPRRH